MSAGVLARGFFSRALHPGHLYCAFNLHRKRKAHRTTFDDSQLALYARMFPTGFLHYGYFDDPATQPEHITLADIEAAQTRYAERLLELATQRELPVLDVGCGMGGLSRMLAERGFAPTALTPDRTQIAYIKETLPAIPVLRTKFEDLAVGEHRGKYGTVFTSESLQYLKLDRALPLMQEILHPGGSWIACDFFRIHADDQHAGHVWDEFVRKLDDTGWRITHERDVTPNVLPTLRYVNMWATRFGVPLMAYSFKRLERKQPGLHHLLANVLDALHEVVDENIGIIDPERFAASKRYMLLKIERV